MFPRGSSVLLSAIVGILARPLRPHSLSRQAALRHTLPLLALLSLPLTAQAVFTTPGSFDVSPDGSAGYTIPIQVPTGTAGMAPKLSLSYNSNGGNGVLGMGWSLEGLSQIGRCPKTMAQDGTRGGINLDSNDRYCLDGQRLLSTGGTYGADGTEYRSELANFAKVISYGVAGNGPAWFKVWTKGGQIIEYGNTADSRIEAQGKTTVLAWGVNKISDTKGNYLTVSYTEDNANGETLVNRIDYTGNATSTPTLASYASVQFSYETRPDTSTAYLAGSVIKSTKRMTNVKTYAGTTLGKDYRLTYEQGAATQRSRIKTLAECDAGGVCLQLTALGWQGAMSGSGYSNYQSYNTGVHYNGGENTLYSVLPTDVNGDGKTDLVHVRTEGGGSLIFKTYLSNGTGSYVPQGSYNTGVHYNGGENTLYSVLPTDVNGDGKTDLVHVRTDGGGYLVFKTYLSDGTGSYVPQGGYNTGVHYNGGENTLYSVLPTDVNGDGKTDLVHVRTEGGGSLIFKIYLSDGVGSYVSQGGYNTGVHYGEPTLHTVLAPDVNGDGKTDLVHVRTDSNSLLFITYLSNGNGSYIPQGTYNTGVHYGEPTLFDVVEADVNGDGKTDLVHVRTDGGGYLIFKIYLSDGVGSYVSQGGYNTGVHYNGGENTLYSVLPTDVNGDGKTDLVHVRTDSGSLFFKSYADTSVYADLLGSLTAGLGAVTSVTYKPITDVSVYTKDTGAQSAVYPVQDIQAPMYVVSSLSVSDGLGGTIVTNYTYGGAKVDLSGRGFLGFRWTKAVSPDTNLDLTTYYRQDYPYIGLPLQSEKRTTGGVLLSAVANTYANTSLTTGSATSQFPYVSQTQEQNYELDGSLVTSTTTGYQYDDYGNATEVTVNSPDGFIKTTANLYANDVPNWLLGRLLRSSVTTTAP